MSDSPPRRFDPVAPARLELERVREELARTRAIQALLTEREAQLEAWIAEADRLGLGADTAPLPRFPRLGDAPEHRGVGQWEWVRFALLQADQPMEPKAILARIDSEGGPAISRTSLASLLSKREAIGEVEHVGRAWRLALGAL